MVIDPAARTADGESVRIAKDVLCAGAGAKICLPDGPEEFARALSRRGRRRPVVIGDDRALRFAVGVLHKERELAQVAVSVVPVGTADAVTLSRALGVPTDTVAAARTVLDGDARPLDLLTDDSDGIVLGGLRIPYADGAAPAGTHPAGGRPATAPAAPAAHGEGGGASWWRPAARTARAALSALAAQATGRERRAVPGQRLRIEADGVLLADLDQPVHQVRVVPGPRSGDDGTDAGAPAAGDGLAEVVVDRPGDDRPLRARARAVTVSGPDFRYRADAVVGGPVRTRTWTVQPGAWWLTLPRE
ncbi:diacylglycerol kinase family protein [Streptomyces catenulae]|uniref:Diacylglycerol kinase family protein n=1 Tax=Streptomyces catenulae TaxID=66875 RepID=A0ABV2YXT2_9ACTN|nr:diacylglycerol kinase family protein [Streptomyces catenulae]